MEYRSDFNVYFDDNINEGDLKSSAYVLIHSYAYTPGGGLKEAVIPVLSSVVATHSFCLRYCRGSLNANQLLDSFTCHSLLPQVRFMAVYWQSACKMVNTLILWIRYFPYICYTAFQPV